MSRDADPPGRMATPRRALLAILAFQVALAGFLLAGDLGGIGSLGLPGMGPKAPRMDTPVRPGDQTRRFQPATPRPGGAPAGDLPKRLTLTPVAGGPWRLEGAIAPGDADRIIDQLGGADAPPAALALNSPGGSVQDALTLGRHLRRQAIDTGLGASDICLSACPYLLAAGPDRRVHPDAWVGVHQHYFGESTILPAFTAVEDIQRGQGQVMRYLDEMGIDPLMMQHGLTTPPDEIYLLVPEELTRYRLATEITGPA